MTLLTFLSTNQRAVRIAAFGAVLSIALISMVVLLIVFLIRTGSETQNKGAVVANGYGCADIGIDIMEKGGNAADSAIATLFCEGAFMPQTMGLGGGFLLTIYNKTTGEVWSLNSRETAPAAATVNMFNGSRDLAQNGGLSIAVPGELVGYWQFYQRFGGGVSWSELVLPTMHLCREGIYVSAFLAGVLVERREIIYADPIWREMFFYPTTNETLKEGDYFKNLKLADTLEVIAEEGGYALHNGSLTERFVQDIRDHNGIITVEDMNNYSPKWQTPIQSTLISNQTLYSAPLPGSGTVLTFVLNILNGFLDADQPESLTNYQRIVESFKFGYARRTDLGDRNFVDVNELISNLTSRDYADRVRELIFDNKTSQDPLYYGARTVMVEDHGTAHINVLAPNGDAVSVTSTINYVFGAKFVSESTGIVLNDQMDDFSSPSLTNIYGIPPSPSNFIVPGKRPMSSMCPTIVLDGNKDVLLLIGGAGGSRITSSVAQVILRHLWYGYDLKKAMDKKRVHHQLLPMVAALENEFEAEDTYVVDGLRKIGHNIEFVDSHGFAAVTAISKVNKTLVTAVFDKRRPGSVSYMD